MFCLLSIDVKIDNVPKYKILLESDNKLNNETKLKEISNFINKTKDMMIYEDLGIKSIVANL